MVRWFSSQITRGGGHYSRSAPNISSRTTYNRLLNANSLLWIGTILGADRDKLRRAAEEAGQGKARATAAACGVVRKYIPFDDLLPLARGWLQELEKVNGSVSPGEDDESPAITREETPVREAEPPQPEESIKYHIPGLNFDDHSNYPTLMSKTIDTAVKMREVFKRYM